MASTSSSASTTPMPLTPQSTGGPSIAFSASSSSSGGLPSSPTSAALKKSRRKAAMFDHAGSAKPVKPFSRSAAKRESVLALGSIEHLQQYFTKTGMVNKKNPLFDKKHYGLVPAIGGMPLSPTENEAPPTMHATLVEQMPPPPPVPRPQPPPMVVEPHVKTNEAHPDTLLPGVISELSELVRIWAIDDPGDQVIDVLPLLRTTTRTIHTVRNYVLSLPDDLMAESKPHTFSKSETNTPPDPLSLIRRCSLEILGCLRELEEIARIPLSDDAYDAQSDGGGSRGIPSRGASPLTTPNDLPGTEDIRNQYYGDLGITFSLVQVHGKIETVPIWEDDDDDGDFEDEGAKEKRELWHETLEVGNGWLYRQDIKLSDLPKERTIVRSYLDAVDDVLFPSKGGKNGERGWEIERKRLETRTSRFAALGSGGVRSRSKSRRVSSGEALDRGSTDPGLLQASSALLLDPGSGGKRRVSTGMLNLAGPVKFTAEPEEMGGIAEGEEGDEDASDQELDDDELPDWAKRSTFLGDDLGRAYAFLSQYLPAAFHHALIPPSLNLPSPSPSSPPTTEPSRSAFLSSLASGQLLCHAYNICVRKSKHPWGFVSKEGIHDIISLEKAAAAEGKPAASNKTGWTFRRTDNLRLWIGALKLRYMLPIQIPAQLISALPPSLLKLPSVVNAATHSPSKSRAAQKGWGAPSSPRIMAPPSIQETKSVGATPESGGGEGSKAPVDSLLFDAQAVARKDEGWEDMLERVLVRWMWKAINEKRKALPTPIG